jgi:uncharacterized protein (DUF3820 family)
MCSSNPLSETPKDWNDAYGDLDLMPFGKYVNERLQDVPASYLHWLWINRPISDRKLENYIKNNLKALKQEYPDGIWK